jgi:hypothetical protein
MWRRERMISNLTIDTLQKRIESSKGKMAGLASQGGAQKEIDKLANSIDAVGAFERSVFLLMLILPFISQDTRDVDSQLRRLAFSRFAIWQEIKFLHHHKGDVTSLYSHFVHEQGRYASSIVEEWAALAPIVDSLPHY